MSMDLDAEQPAGGRRRRGFNRASQEPSFGATFMLHRRFVLRDGAGSWEICNGWDEGHEPDSAVHRYDREVGFAICAEEQVAVDRNQRLADACTCSHQAQEPHADGQEVGFI